ncbi:unnamed protein product [marine sediment metagenome]|uniref:Uncharacterized protein n=1 Tax=marine sediment metagenome TaxID=412755 RepID=X1SEP6_9ZZZZ
MNIVTVIAILCITALEIVALGLGINGTALAAVVAIIAGLGGYEIRRKREKK